MSYALPSHALPHVLPNRALLLIHEYSRPMTRHDWLYSRPIITVFKLYLTVWPPTSELQYIILSNIKNTEWYKMFYYVEQYGVREYNKEIHNNNS